MNPRIIVVNFYKFLLIIIYIYFSDQFRRLEKSSWQIFPKRQYLPNWACGKTIFWPVLNDIKIRTKTNNKLKSTNNSKRAFQALNNDAASGPPTSFAATKVFNVFVSIELNSPRESCNKSGS